MFGLHRDEDKSYTYIQKKAYVTYLIHSKHHSINIKSKRRIYVLLLLFFPNSLFFRLNHRNSKKKAVPSNRGITSVARYISNAKIPQIDILRILALRETFVKDTIYTPPWQILLVLCSIKVRCFFPPWSTLQETTLKT